MIHPTLSKGHVTRSWVQESVVVAVAIPICELVEVSGIQVDLS